jgi:rhodanese-related sulfurtransferase
MRKFTLFFAPVLLGILIFTSCSKDEDTVVNEAQILVEYLESADSPYGNDFVNSDLPAIISSTDVKGLNETGDVYIVDIRSAADFETGHIKNAVNVEAGQVLAHLESEDLSGYQKIAVVCYTGQTAGWVTSILRLSGYENAYSMKWGMCYWHDDFAGKWNGNIGNAWATHFNKDAVAKPEAGNLPALSTGKTTGAEIFADRVAAVLAEGFGKANVTNQAVNENKNDYFILNYWNEDHYNDPGHIEGAIQYTPKESLKLAADLKTLPTDKTIAVYCYTGQTSAFLTAYLRILGYDAKSLLFGTNGMIYDQCVEKQMTVWTEATPKNFEYKKPAM